MDKQRNEARDAAMIGAFFLGYAAIVWYAARPNTPLSFADRVIDAVARAVSTVPREAASPGLEFHRLIRDDLIAEENKP